MAMPTAMNKIPAHVKASALPNRAAKAPHNSEPNATTPCDVTDPQRPREPKDRETNSQHDGAKQNRVGNTEARARGREPERR